VNADLTRARQIVWGETEKRCYSPNSKKNPQTSAERRKQRNLGQELPQQAPAARAERGPGCKFSASARRASEQEIDKVCAGYQQEKSDSPG
jgi:hypothetical protein